jgi:hypothetical protein
MTAIVITSVKEYLPVRSTAKQFALAVAVLALAAGAAGPAKADLTVYFGIDEGNGGPPTTPNLSLSARNAFISALSGVGVENFESQSTGSFPTTLSFSGTAVTASASTADSANNYVNTGTPNGTFATSGTHFLFNPGSGVAVNDSLTFSSAVTGFGMYVTDLSDGTSPVDQIQYKLTFADNTTQTVTTSVGPSNLNANVLFFGVVVTNPFQSIKSIQILNTQPGSDDSLGIDDMTIGQEQSPLAAPEPSTFVSAGIAGLFGLSYAWRRKKTAIA